jgi:hypothetical protein
MFNPIPEIPYDKFKKSLHNHKWVHYLLHSTFCLFRDNINGRHVYYTPKKWLETIGPHYPSRELSQRMPRDLQLSKFSPVPNSLRIKKEEKEIVF